MPKKQEVNNDEDGGDDGEDYSSSGVDSEEEIEGDEPPFKRQKIDQQIKHQESEVNISNFFGFQNKQQITAVKVAPQTVP